MNLGGKAKPSGYFSARREGDHFYDIVEIIPEYKETFFNFNSTLIEPNKPMAPVYSKSMILPSNAKIRGIKVKKIDSAVTNISIPLFRDEFYNEKNFTGTYPEKEWWKKERNFLDGRREITFSVPIRYNGSAIANSFSFKVEYDADLEITEFFAPDIIVGEIQRFYLRVYSKKDREAQIFLRIGEDYIRENVSLKSGENELILQWNKTSEAGDYNALAVLISGKERVGPRATTFSIKERPNLFLQTKEKIVQVWENFWERLSRIFSSEKVESKKENPETRVELWVENGTVVKKIVTTDYTLIIKRNEEKREINFTSASGNIIIKKTLGNREEIISGNEKIKEEFENAIKKLKETLE
ncbi:MAG: hypothetical protein DRO01_06750 [Thermoproteota archaeon]|nr:MAG: hypothetical protein DRO01_06750 [Candidatus Korarchaeota archaeon]